MSVGWRFGTSSVEEYAGAIAHEAYHNLLSQEPEATIDDLTGREEERKCIDFEIRVLEKLGNAEILLRNLQMLTRFPTHVGSEDNIFDLMWRIRRG